VCVMQAHEIISPGKSAERATSDTRTPRRDTGVTGTLGCMQSGYADRAHLEQQLQGQDALSARH
ncbi:MAG: hypothetical protein ACPIOQ_46345, partial [Promethearchaeia archaeon]